MRCDIIHSIIKYLYLLKDEQVYVFGSVLEQNKTPSDIDLLIVYFEYSDTMQRRINEFGKQLEKESRLPVDITILSVEEEKQVCFLEKVRAIQLK